MSRFGKDLIDGMAEAATHAASDMQLASDRSITVAQKSWTHMKPALFSQQRPRFPILAAAALIGCLLVAQHSQAQRESDQIFDLMADSNFNNYRTVAENYARKHRLAAGNKVCVLGSVLGDGSRTVWFVWLKAGKIILWDGGAQPLDLSRRVIDLKTDVVPNEADLHGSSYLVTQSWVTDMTQTCNARGVQLQFDDGGPAKRR